MEEKTKENIEKIVGVSTKKISGMDVRSFDSLLEKKLGKKLEVKTSSNPHLIGRGSVLISMGRLSQIETIEKKLEKI
jgi:F0F1-type ATP synthase delta subunit